MIPFQTVYDLATTFENHPDNAHLCIENRRRGHRFSISATPCSDTTRRLFKELIGEDHLLRVCGLDELGLDPLQLPLTKKNVSKIIVGLLHLKLCHYPERFEQLKPLFMGREPDLDNHLYDIPLTAGKGARGLTERVYFAAHHYFRLQGEPRGNCELIDAEFLTSRMADREMTLDTIVHLTEGDYRVDGVFTDGGSYTVALRKNAGDAPLKLVCRGTSALPRSTGGAKSCLNDIQLEIGTMGVTSIWPHLARYIEDNGYNAVELYGKSLGGAHAQLLAILVEGVLDIRVAQLTTVCSVGVGDSIAQLFNEKVLRHRQRPFPIHVIRNGGDRAGAGADFIPLVGGVHLGDHKRCNVRVTYLNEASAGVTAFPGNLSIFKKILLLLQSFGKAHNRQSTLKPFAKITLANESAKRHLRIGAELEPLRYILAIFAHLATFTLLNRENFALYFDRKKGASAEAPFDGSQTEPLLT